MTMALRLPSDFEPILATLAAENAVVVFKVAARKVSKVTITRETTGELQSIMTETVTLLRKGLNIAKEQNITKASPKLDITTVCIGVVGGVAIVGGAVITWKFLSWLLTPPPPPPLPPPPPPPPPLPQCQSRGEGADERG